MKRATLVCLMILASSFAAHATEMPISFQRGLWETSLSGEYLSVNGNYVKGSGFQSLTSGNTYALFDSNLTSRYVFFPNWAVYGGLDMGYAESNSFNVKRTNSGLSSGFVGLQGEWDLGSVMLIPEFSVLFPFDKADANTTTVMKSEGVSIETGLLHLQMPLAGVTVFGHVGYEMRGGGRSSLIPWGAGLEANFQAIHIGGSIFGFQSGSNDADTGTTNEAARNAQTILINGGAMQFYSLNPTVMDSEVYLLFNLTRSLRMAFGGGTTISGSNMASGYHGEATLTWRVATQPQRRSRSHISVDPYVDQFHEDTDDGVDQTLFRKPPPPKPAEPAVRMRRDSTTPVVPPQSTTPVNEDDQAERQRQQQQEQLQKMQNELDNTEMQIDLKPVKKKKKKSQD